MSVKIKISYERQQELDGVIRLLRPAIKCCRFPKGQQGQYKKAYVLLKDENVVEA